MERTGRSSGTCSPFQAVEALWAYITDESEGRTRLTPPTEGGPRPVYGVQSRLHVYVEFETPTARAPLLGSPAPGYTIQGITYNPNPASRRNQDLRVSGTSPPPDTRLAGSTPISGGPGKDCGCPQTSHLASFHSKLVFWTVCLLSVRGW